MIHVLACFWIKSVFINFILITTIIIIVITGSSSSSSSSSVDLLSYSRKY